MAVEQGCCDVGNRAWERAMAGGSRIGDRGGGTSSQRQRESLGGGGGASLRLVKLVR